MKEVEGCTQYLEDKDKYGLFYSFVFILLLSVVENIPILVQQTQRHGTVYYLDTTYAQTYTHMGTSLDLLM